MTTIIPDDITETQSYRLMENRFCHNTLYLLTEKDKERLKGKKRKKRKKRSR